MGEVWLATQTSGQHAGRSAVLKLLRAHLKEDREFVTMFFDEARIAATLKHPHIARIFEVGEDQGEYFIAMEYVPGVPLRDAGARAIEATGQELPPALLCRVIADTARALAFAHQAVTATGAPLDLIHRDVSPQNILLGFDGTVKLIDFGVAKAANKLVRTATGIIKGKYAYMSPEQAWGRELDGRSDVFGLGVVLWELLCSQRLFKREKDQDTLRAVVGAELHAPSLHSRRVSRALDAVVMKALERELPRRYASADAFADALEQYLAKQPEPSSAKDLGAWLQRHFPDEVKEAPSAPVEPTVSTAPSATSLELQHPEGAQVIDDGELKLRLAALGPKDTVSGALCVALVAATKAQAGLAAATQLKKAGPGGKGFSESRRYPTADFLRLLWRAGALAARGGPLTSDTLEALGTSLGPALLDGVLGPPLEETAHAGFDALLNAFTGALVEAISPGVRRVSRSTPQRATLVFKGEVLPLALYVGLLKGLGRSLFRVVVQAKVDKPAAERFELELSW
jgi:serine/threonine-protein kinase